MAAKVDAAQSAYGRGDLDATAGALGALENEPTNIGGNHISEGARSMLLDLLDQLAASL